MSLYNSLAKTRKTKREKKKRKLGIVQIIFARSYIRSAVMASCIRMTLCRSRYRWRWAFCEAQTDPVWHNNSARLSCSG